MFLVLGFITYYMLLMNADITLSITTSFVALTYCAIALVRNRKAGVKTPKKVLVLAAITLLLVPSQIETTDSEFTSVSEYFSKTKEKTKTEEPTEEVRTEVDPIVTVTDSTYYNKAEKMCVRTIESSLRSYNTKWTSIFYKFDKRVELPDGTVRFLGNKLVFIDEWGDEIAGRYYCDYDFGKQEVVRFETLRKDRDDKEEEAVTKKKNDACFVLRANKLLELSCRSVF